ncbi:hypothetical protein ATI61_103411 [Archangium gephyra]|uniref:DUF2934 domain-containing protein n=1 Tax=Archangium gephyra TaxID=48 RepID=A0AAC8Q605_9BACT|nr:DUF2934 domain-containing protein [Archangium gephyra]AKJ01699.1 Hypothetical protein AA314_03325 [Archangium gephyra]REG34511.1 hypothetical protein ATI61_103411 [Archangium gephyra]
MARTHAKTSHPTPAQQMPENPARNAAASNRTQPTHEQIARRAYELFLARGGGHGQHEQDWAQAERELKLGRC